jgi:hypothetical protein
VTDDALAAFRAAGYCGATRQGKPGTCSRPPGRHADGDHVDYYNGRKDPADTEGYRWKQEPPALVLALGKGVQTAI